MPHEPDPQIHPDMEASMDHFSCSAATIAISSLAGYLTIRYNMAYAAPFSIAFGMKSSESWQKAWRALDEYQANKKH